MAAWVAVRRNNGAPGIYRTTLAEVEQYGGGDVLVMCKSWQQAEAALARLRILLAELGLEPKEAKTARSASNATTSRGRPVNPS